MLCRGREYCSLCSLTCKTFFFAHTLPGKPEQSPAQSQPSLSVFISLWLWYNILVQTLRDLSILKMYDLLWPFFQTASVFYLQSIVQVNSRVSVFFNQPHLFSQDGDSVLLISYPPKNHNHLFNLFQDKLIVPTSYHKVVNLFLYSASCPSLILPRTAESSDYFCRWQYSKLKMNQV